MPNLALDILGILTRINGGNNFSAQAILPASGATASDTNTSDFSVIMSRLNCAINNASANNFMNTLSPISSGFNINNNMSSAIAPNISAIVAEIKKNGDSGSMTDVDSRIRKYLLDHYGGSEYSVIRNLAGVQTLPSKMMLMQGQVFDQIVLKLSTQVRESLYSSYNASSLLESDSSSTDESETSVSSSDDDSSSYSGWL